MPKAKDKPLETVTLERVPILSEGGPYYGTGSPPEGDYYSKDDLEGIATANRELAAEVKAPNKIGHSKKQKLLANSGLSEDEMPAAGWLKGDTFTVEEGDDGKWKLYADIVKVPGKLAKLFEAGAFRTRSVELSKVTAQGDDGETVYENVVTGLAWLGAKAPAVRTLDDIFAYYADTTETTPTDAGERRALVVELLRADSQELPADVTRTVEYSVEPVLFAAAEAASIIWQPEEGFEDLRQDLNAALNPSATSERRYYVQDVSIKLDKCIVNDWNANETWVVPFTMEDGEPVPSPATEWVLAEQAWVEAANALSEKHFTETLKMRDATADTSVVPELLKTLKDATDDQVVQLAKSFGFEGEDAAALRPQLEEHLKAFTVGEEAPVVEPPKVEETAPAAADEQAREMAELRARADLGAQAHEDRRVEKREQLIAYGLKDGEGDSRILPAQVENWRTFYDANPELATAQLKALPVIPARTYGADEVLPHDISDEDATEAGEAAWREYAAATGIELEEAR